MSTNVALCMQLYTEVYKCRANFVFFWALFCDVTNSSSPSPMGSEMEKCGKLTPYQQATDIFKFSSGELGGFSVRAPRLSAKNARKGGFTTKYNILFRQNSRIWA